ncbi:hypothetical protein MKMG_00807 [Methanogenium sp. MK-MG]|nr:hypothetical protein MKMG_00807 [Methanogenium sp. MK-MG]
MHIFSAVKMIKKYGHFTPRFPNAGSERGKKTGDKKQEGETVTHVSDIHPTGLHPHTNVQFTL